MWRHFRRITTDNISESDGDSSSNSHAHGELILNCVQNHCRQIYSCKRKTNKYYLIAIYCQFSLIKFKKNSEFRLNVDDFFPIGKA